jgi:TRAP-type C4-dicarboxylate transport system permease small subunit
VLKVTGPISFFGTPLRTVASWLSVIAGFFLILMMTLDVADVAGRYFFLKPVPGTYEVIALLLIIAGTWGMASAEFDESHIRVDLITKRMPVRFQKVLDLFAHLIVIFILVVVTWQMFSIGISHLILGTSNKSADLGIPFAPFNIIFGIGTGVFLLAILLHLARLIQSFRGG